MTLPLTAVTIIRTTDAFCADPDILLPAFERLKSKGVNTPIYYGPEASQDSSVGFVVVNWDSHEQHSNIIHSPFYQKIGAGLESALAGPPNVYHVQFSAPPTPLDKPITEIVFLHTKAPENHAVMVEILSGIAEATNNPFVFGLTREDENKYIALRGWESVEAHRRAVSNPEYSRGLLQKLHSLADEDLVYHAKLKKFV